MKDDRLEAAIDEVGRDRVFARARSLGWGGYNTAPKFVWWGIVQELKAEGEQSNQNGQKRGLIVEMSANPQESMLYQLLGINL